MKNTKASTREKFEENEANLLISLFMIIPACLREKLIIVYEKLMIIH